jgi:hypothetical protein
MVNLEIAKILDIILIENWFKIQTKDTWSLIYLINYLFELHDVFIGSLMAQRMLSQAEKIILRVLEERKGQLNQEQSYQLNSLLNCEALRGSKVQLDFDIKTKEVKAHFGEKSLDEKLKGLNKLSTILGECYTLKDQLEVVANKCTPLLKQLF